MTLVYGNALKFVAGSSQYARSGANVGSPSVDNFSMVCWVKVAAYGAGDTFLFQNGANDARGMGMFITSAGVFQGDMAFVANINSAFTLVVDTWYHIAWIRNSGTSQLYVNGEAKGSTSGSSPNSGNDYITLGAWTSSGGTTDEFASATVDDARFYERAISTTELLQLYNNGNVWPYTDISATSLKYWYKLDETSGTSVADSSGNGIGLTTSGTPTWVQGIVATGSVNSSPLSNLLMMGVG